MFRRSLILLLPAALLINGCAASTPGSGSSPGVMERFSESRKLAEGVELLDEGKPVAAAKMLHAVTTGKPVPGVTDEALFRLALLSLRGGEKGYANASQLLKRLKREYPGSTWTAQAAPLAALLNDVEELREQNRSIKGSSQAQGKENGDLKKEIGELKREISALNSQIRQLKNLDLELEQRGR